MFIVLEALPPQPPLSSILTQQPPSVHAPVPKHSWGPTSGIPHGPDEAGLYYITLRALQGQNPKTLEACVIPPGAVVKRREIFVEKLSSSGSGHSFQQAYRSHGKGICRAIYQPGNLASTPNPWGR